MFDVAEACKCYRYDLGDKVIYKDLSRANIEVDRVVYESLTTWGSEGLVYMLRGSITSLSSGGEWVIPYHRTLAMLLGAQEFKNDK